MSWTINVTVKDGAVEKTSTVSEVPDGTYVINGHQAAAGQGWDNLSLHAPTGVVSTAHPVKAHV
jgi:hypothetical protein